MDEELKGNVTEIGDYLARQQAWSSEAFGPGKRTLGIVAHIRKELAEIEAEPDDLSEWIDVMILAIDGYWRHGGKPGMLMRDLRVKQRKNITRRWPAFQSEDQAVEHDRSAEDPKDARIAKPEVGREWPPAKAGS